MEKRNTLGSDVTGVVGATMSMRDDFRQVGELVWLCAQTMRQVTRAEMGSTVNCPFKAQVMQLEEASRQIEIIADRLPSRWDRDLAGRSETA